MPDTTQPDIRYRRRDWALAVVVAALAFALFAPTIGYDFVGLDDLPYVSENPMTRDGFSVEALKWAWTENLLGYWAPVLWMSYQLDGTLFGPEPWGFHATNVLLHALNAALVFWLLRRLTRRRWPAFWAALLWAVHPLRVESVAWITERKCVGGLFSSCVFWPMCLHMTGLGGAWLDMVVGGFPCSGVAGQAGADYHAVRAAVTGCVAAGACSLGMGGSSGRWIPACGGKMAVLVGGPGAGGGVVAGEFFAGASRHAATPVDAAVGLVLAASVLFAARRFVADLSVLQPSAVLSAGAGVAGAGSADGGGLVLAATASAGQVVAGFLVCSCHPLGLFGGPRKGGGPVQLSAALGWRLGWRGRLRKSRTKHVGYGYALVCWPWRWRGHRGGSGNLVRQRDLVCAGCSRG